MKKPLFAILLLVILGCSNSSEKKNQVVLEPMKSPMIPFQTDSIQVDGDLNGFEVKLSTTHIEEGLDLVKVKLTSPQAATPPKFILKWKFPSVDIAKFWNPNLDVDKAGLYSGVSSSSTRYAPVTSYMNTNDENRFAFAVADALNKVNTSAYIMEEDANFYCNLVFFDELYPAISNYETEILIDRRNQHFSKTLGNITDWWAKQKNYLPAIPPEESMRPMYSTWYSYHQSLDVDAIIEECRESKKMGIEAVIVDDGWQTMDNKRGYAFAGDWKPDRIPDMKGFVDRIHELDMKFMLWYSVPLMGKNAENFPKFKGKYLYNWESQGAWVLDPRYPEVREFIINTYEKAMADWGLDGFKLDFMGFFKPGADTKLTAEDGRDFASVNHAVDKLMTDIMSRLKLANPQILIEFRQPYIGPLMRKYGNMLRAADCPNMATINKVRVTDIRLLGGKSAVHSDMLMWHPEDEVESAALQILNIIFSVPQISVRLNEIPQEHKDMIAFWIEYWNENRDVLLNGDFYPQMPDALYPLISSVGEEKGITAVYNQTLVKTEKYENLKAFDVINAQNQTEVVILNASNLGSYQVKAFDCNGHLIYDLKTKLTQGSQKFSVPASGLLQFQKMN